MQEIRLCWSERVSQAKHELNACTQWAPQDEASLGDLTAMCRAGSDLFGPGSHWIEQRGCEAAEPVPAVLAVADAGAAGEQAQVRLCWNDQVRLLKAESETGSAWAPVTQALLGYFDAMAEAGNTVFGAGTHWVEHRYASAASPTPELEVKQLVHDSMQAWKAGDMKGHVRFFTDSAILVTPDGVCVRGHAGLLAAFKQERMAMPAMDMTVVTQEIIHPAKDSAVVLMKGYLYHSGMPEPQAWASTQTVVRQSIDWKIATLQICHPR